ncbi:MAG: hypothetical protein OHK0046_46910 [Anaerolineae bacterium]
MFARHLLLACLMMLLFGSSIHAQNETIVLTVAVQDRINPVFTEDLFAPFYEAHPNVRVVIVNPDNTEFFTPPFSNLETHLNAAADYASSADVLRVSTSLLSVETTRARYILDLAPLIQNDPLFDPAVFFTPAWESFQWDGGVWAVPTSVGVDLLLYDVEAFDNAGLTYPSESWTLDDFANAARQLAERDSEGGITQPGFVVIDPVLFLRSLSSTSLADDTTLPTTPRLNSPEMADLMQQWVDLLAEGVVAQFNPRAGYELTDIPMSIGERVFATRTPDRPLQAALLPGGTAGLRLNAFAISAGTQHPELAYALVKFLSESVDVANRFFELEGSAQRDLFGTGRENFFEAPTTPELDALTLTALDNALPYSELRYGGWLYAALGRAITSGDAETALLETQAELEAALATAETYRNTPVVVTAPPAAPALEPDEVILRFGVGTGSSVLVNEQDWERVVADFASADGEVGHIELVTSPNGPWQENTDCFYYTDNLIPGIGVDTLLALDPLMDADPQFAPEDALAGALEQVQFEGRTYAYPLIIQPAILWINPEAFQRAALPVPGATWTITEFTDALRALAALEDVETPFAPTTFGNRHLLMLIAAYGGQPIMYNASSLTYNLTDPAVVEAMRQVIGLIDDGLIAYTGLGDLTGSGLFQGYLAPIHDDFVDPRTTYNRNASETDITYHPAAFPQGSAFTPVSYRLGTGYISASTQHPEACYRWLAHIAAQPELLAGMPAWRSVLNDPRTAEVLNTDVVNFYREFESILNAPNALLFPEPSSDSDSLFTMLYMLWINRALDAVILEGADLETALLDAQADSEAFDACMQRLFNDPSLITNGLQSIIACATDIDPDLASVLPFGG